MESTDHNGMYQGHGFHKSLPNGKASGAITVSSGMIRFEPGVSGVRSESFPIDGCEFSLGGASDRLVFIRHLSRPEWSFYTSDRGILNNPLLQSVPSIALQLQKAKRTRWFNHSVVVAVLVAIVMIPLVLFSSMDTLTGFAAKQVPAEWEYKLGETVYAQYQIGEQLMSQEKTKKYFLPIVDPLLMALENPRFTPQFSIVNNPEINAFALPGGFVVINSGLILAADSADEMLGVLAHELSHVSEQHSIRNIISAASVYLSIDLLLGDVSGLLAMIADAAPLLLNQQFSRGFEREADAKGYELLARANIDPKGLASFFEKLAAEQQKQLEKVEDETTRELMIAAEGLLSTHPATEERIAYILSLVEKNSKNREGPYLVFVAQFDELKEAVKKFVVTIEATIEATTETTSESAES